MRDFKCLWFTSFVSNKNGNIVNHSTFFPFLDVNVRVSSLTLLGALVSAQAPLPEVQLLLQQPVTMSGDVGCTREEHMSQNWRQQCTLEDGEEGICWLLGLCVSLVTQPREGSHSDSETIPHLSPNLLEPSPVRLEALQVRSSCCMSTCLHGVCGSDLTLATSSRFWPTWWRATSVWHRGGCLNCVRSVLAVWGSRIHLCSYMEQRWNDTTALYSYLSVINS